ncbi:MAG: PorV/PorQ family protein [Candidatus Cloacimonetes bacterium]|nr:PorV/PorQ family protein [Candidatus Cloacimonadota bacterium]
MKKSILILVMIIIFGLSLQGVEPINIKSDYGWKMLTIPLSPSIAAMAGTGASISDEAGSFIEHPAAGLVGNVRAISVSQNLWIFDTQLNSIAINTITGATSYGFALRALDYGKIDARDLAGDIIGEFHPLDVNLIGNFAYRITPNYYAGINLMLLYQKIQTKSSTGVAFDLGLTYLTPISGLSVDAAVKHLGKTQKVNQSRIKLPVTPELAFNYLLPVDIAIIHTELKMLKHPDDDNIRVQLGANANINSVFNVRAGYYFNHDTQNITAGIGLQLKRIDFNYAYLPFSNDIRDAHSFGLSYKF